MIFNSAINYAQQKEITADLNISTAFKNLESMNLEFKVCQLEFNI